MAKTGAERQAAYRLRHGSNKAESKINVAVPVTVVTALREITKQSGLTRKAMIEKLILEAKEQAAAPTLLCNQYMEKLKQLANHHSTSPEQLLEQMIDEQHRRMRLHETASIVSYADIARFLLALYDGDSEKARKEFYAHVQNLNPGFVFRSNRVESDLEKWYRLVRRACEDLDKKLKKAKADTPEEIPAP